MERIYKTRTLAVECGWARCPHPLPGPDRQFAVFSFDSSYQHYKSAGALLSVIIGTIPGDFVEMLRPTPETDGPSLLYEPPILLLLTAADCRNFYCPTSVFLTCVTGEVKYLRAKRACRYSIRKT